MLESLEHVWKDKTKFWTCQKESEPYAWKNLDEYKTCPREKSYKSLEKPSTIQS